MGPLEGLKIIEMAGIGPGPFAAMMLADMGAEVVRVDRLAYRGNADPARDVLNRGRASVGVDLKHPDGVQLVLRLVDQVDGLIEGFRPGVMERLGVGPGAGLAPHPPPLCGRTARRGAERRLPPARRP